MSNQNKEPVADTSVGQGSLDTANIKINTTGNNLKVHSRAQSAGYKQNF